MDKFGKIIGYGCLGIMLLLISCIREDLDDCPPELNGGSYIRFVYDYNMAFEDLFSKQVSKLNVYLFDEAGTFVSLLTDESADGSTFPKDYTMKIPQELKNISRFVVWSGLDNDMHTITGMTPGVSKITNLIEQLKVSSGNRYTTKMQPLWYGKALYNLPNTTKTSTDSEGILRENDTTVVSLVKNTNLIRVVLQAVEDSMELDIDDFKFTLEAVNTAYDYNDDVCSDTHCYYYPYLTYNEDQTCGVAEMNMMRLLSDRDNRLLIEHIPGKETLLEIDLNKIVNAMKVQDYSGMPLQEYMDREDEYKITVFVKKTNAGSGESDGSWTVVEIQMKPWISRDQNNPGN